MATRKTPPAAVLIALQHAARHGPMALSALDAAAALDTIPPLSGLVPSDDDVRDFPFKASGRMPLYEMDMRAECSPIRNQGDVGACTAFHVDGHCGRYAKRAGAAPAQQAFSTRANYAMSRQLMGLTGDSGASLRAAIHAAYKFGMPYEAEFPYPINNPAAVINTTKLSDAVMAAASRNKVEAYYRIDYTAAELFMDENVVNKRIDRALADGYTVGIGLFVHRWFRSIAGPLSTHAALRKSRPGDSTWSDVIGAHAMVIVGRSDALGGYIVRNSWGPAWGDAGYYLMPFADTLEAFEFWAVAAFDGSGAPAAAYDMDSWEARVARLYRAAFARYPDAGGLQYQTAQAQAHGIIPVADAFMASPEFRAKYGAAPSDENYVTALYANVLGRTPDAAGYAFQLNALRTNTSRAQMLVNFAESPECRAMP
jgi:hypothetical protein